MSVALVKRRPSTYYYQRKLRQPQLVFGGDSARTHIDRTDLSSFRRASSSGKCSVAVSAQESFQMQREPSEVA